MKESCIGKAWGGVDSRSILSTKMSRRDTSPSTAPIRQVCYGVWTIATITTLLPPPALSSKPGSQEGWTLVLRVV